MTEINNFTDVKRALLTLPGQCTGRIQLTCETGEYYKDFSLCFPSRPADIQVVEKFISQQFYLLVWNYFQSTKGTIYWRVKPEFKIETYHHMVILSNDGPDKDLATGQSGYADKSWVTMSAYCRVVRSDMPSIFDEVAA